MKVTSIGYYKFLKDHKIQKGNINNVFLEGSVLYVDKVDFEREMISLDNIFLPWDLPVVRMIEESTTPQHIFYDFERKACFPQAASAYEIDEAIWNVTFSKITKDLCKVNVLQASFHREKDRIKQKLLLDDIRRLYVSIIWNMYSCGYASMIDIDEDIRTVMRNADWALFDSADDASEEIERKYKEGFEKKEHFVEMEVRQSEDDFYSIHYTDIDYPHGDKLVINPDYKRQILSGVKTNIFYNYDMFTNIVEIY